MGPSNIISIEPRWNLEWANDPKIEVTLDCDTPEMDQLVWTPETPEAKEYFFMVTETFAPFVRFVFFTKPFGDPRVCGALGGKYVLENGAVLLATAGWSSRDSAVNLHQPEMVKEEVVDVTLLLPNGGLLAGWSMHATALREHPLWPEGCHLVRTLKFRDEEPCWTISTSPDGIVKPEPVNA